MEDLRQIAFAYFKDASKQIQWLVDEFFSEMDVDGNDRVSLQEFTEYMERYEDCKHLCNSLFFDELKKEGHEELDFMDVITLFYIVYSGKPFCNGQCKKFIKGVYFACVKCFDDYATDAINTFNVCTACYADGKYVHGHDKLLDSFLLLQSKRMTALNQRAASVTNEDLRQTAFAYYKYASTDVQRLVDEFFYEMDLDKNDRVSLQEFTEYMERHGDYKHLCNSLFFDELKKEGHEELDFMDVMTLLYIIYSGKPFCNGQCKKFIKGVYFAGVKCFDDYATDATNTFNVCPACYADGKYVHGHDKFLDSFLLLQSKRMTALNQRATSVTNESKALEYGSTSETSNSSSPAPEAPQAPQAPPAPPRPLTPHTSNAMVPVNPRPKNSAGRKALKTIEVLLALGNIFAATQCTIM